jgi:hypothetical protein
MITVCFSLSQDLSRGTPGGNQENGTAMMVSNPADIQVVSSECTFRALTPSPICPVVRR